MALIRPPPEPQDCYRSFPGVGQVTVKYRASDMQSALIVLMLSLNMEVYYRLVVLNSGVVFQHGALPF